jgi:MSHA biogenesis protein MshN
MSLINQMLKDLERRGARANDVNVADTEMIITTKLDAINTPRQSATIIPRLSLIKMGGIMVLLAGGTYLWMQTSLAQSHDSVIANTHIKSQPIAHTTPAITAKLTPSIATIDTSPPLFETELSYSPSDIQPVAEETQKTKKIQKEGIIANLIPSTTPIKQADPVESAELINPATSGKSIGIEHAEKPSSKLNTDSTAIGKQIRPDQKSGNYYRQALSYLQQGRVAEAQANLALALETNPSNHEARQMLAGLLLENKRNDEARTTLAAGLAIAPEQNDFRMALARLQVEAGDLSGALSTLEKGLSYAKDNADYQNFFATLLQRADHHEEAIDHFTTALSLNSTSPSTLIGLGISLQAIGKLEQSQEAFTRAQATAALRPELAMFVEQRIKQISQRLQN